MDEPCFNCGERASKYCTVVLDVGPNLEDKPICEECYAFFRNTTTIDIRTVYPETDDVEPSPSD